ncbi:MAG: UDP-N-acetylglucosamine 1-carboxyvinyltransferase [Bacilli bacterium]
MSKVVINGGKVLNGEIKINGAKNSVVALICASVLCDEVVYLDSVPNISDVTTLIKILNKIGCKTKFNDGELMIDPRGVKNIEIPEDLASQLRASYYFLGSFIGRFNNVDFGLPGGCNLGSRPIDLHLFGFERLNCNIEQRDGKYIISTDHLIGNKIFLDFASVGATLNIMIAATKATGLTVIENAAEEPEIVDVANFLNSMGAKVRGAGTSIIRIEGVDSLSGSRHQVVPDRIQIGTYIIIGALCCEKLLIKNVIGLHLDALLSKLDYAGVRFELLGDDIVVYGRGKYRSFDVTTQTYPGFPTDLQQPLTTFLTQCEGIGTITETIYTERFRHVDYLNSMGANIKYGNGSAIVMGQTKLIANKVIATDLRASSALVIAGLLAEGETTILEISHLIRGYDNVISNLKSIGADIEYFE